MAKNKKFGLREMAKETEQAQNFAHEMIQLTISHYQAARHRDNPERLMPLDMLGMQAALLLCAAEVGDWLTQEGEIPFVQETFAEHANAAFDYVAGSESKGRQEWKAEDVPELVERIWLMFTALNVSKVAILTTLVATIAGALASESHERRQQGINKVAADLERLLLKEKEAT